MRNELILKGKKAAITTAFALMLAFTGCSQSKQPAATEAATEEELAVEDATAAEEASTEATTEEAEEASTEATTEAAAEASTEATTEEAEEASTEATAIAEEAKKGSTEASTEATTKAAAEASTEEPAEETKKGTSEETAKGTTEKPAEETAKGTTEKPAEETTKAKTAKEIEDDLFNDYRYNVDGETIVPEEEKGQAEAKSANGAKPEASAEDTTKAAETGNAEKTPEGKQGNKNNKTGNPYQNVDSQGDPFAFESPDGEFVENPSAPDRYSNSGITKSEDGEYAPANEGKKNTSKDTKEASEHIKQVYAEADERIPELINSDPEQAGKDLYTMITKGLDFLFFGKDFDGYTKDQVDEETIIYLINEMFNYTTIAKSFEAFGVYTELETKYTEALEYLELSKEDPSIIRKLDKIGEEILKEYTTEEETEASLGTAITLTA